MFYRPFDPIRMTSIFSSFARMVKPRAKQFSRRNFSSNATSAEEYYSEHRATAEKWRKITLAGLPIVGALAVYNLVEHLNHLEHHKKHDTPKYKYLRIHKKPFPWECSSCGLLELDCWKACKEEKKMKESEK